MTARRPTRKHARRRRRRNGRWAAVTAGDRLYALALFGLVVLLVVMALGPLQSLEAATSRLDTLTGQRDELQDRVEDLEERERRLQDPEELELLAREELGLVKPGEIPFVVVTPEPEIAKPTEPGGAQEDDRTFWQRLRDAVTRPFR